jgi:hypothetical protein
VEPVEGHAKPRGGYAKSCFFRIGLIALLTLVLVENLGFLSSLGLVLWMPFVTMGSLVALGYSLFFGYGILGLVVFVGANVGAAIFWNKARKHHRDDAFDDRLSFERMDRARDWWVNLNVSDDEPEKGK